jgi:transglutaminase-like putative cysteine protease
VKWDFLREAWREDSRLPAVQVIAKGILVGCFANWHRFAKMALAYARDGIRYEGDTPRIGGEDIAGFTRPGSLEGDIRRGSDDCDMKARTFVALCRAVGLEAEMLPLVELTAAGAVLAHVRGRVNINGKWYTGEPSLARARLGELPADVPREQSDGKWAR